MNTYIHAQACTHTHHKSLIPICMNSHTYLHAHTYTHTYTHSYRKPLVDEYWQSVPMHTCNASTACVDLPACMALLL